MTGDVCLQFRFLSNFIHVHDQCRVIPKQDNHFQIYCVGNKTTQGMLKWENKQQNAKFWFDLCFDFPFKQGAAVVEWLSSWLAEQEDRGSIPGLAT